MHNLRYEENLMNLDGFSVIFILNFIFNLLLVREFGKVLKMKRKNSPSSVTFSSDGGSPPLYASIGYLHYHLGHQVNSKLYSAVCTKWRKLI